VALVFALSLGSTIMRGELRSAFRFALAAVALITFAGLAARGTPGIVVGALAFLAEPLVVAYALLRHQLLGVDLKVRWTVVRGIIAGVFLGAFFLVEQVAQNIVSERYGLLFGLLAAALLLLAFAPIRGVAERIADRALPETSARADERARERAYANALRIAMRHPELTEADERSLAHLADALGLSSDSATRLRREVEAERLAAGGGTPA
jgi:hypothetical protein